MYTSVKEFQELACTVLKKIRDGEFDFQHPGLEEPYYGHVLHYLKYEEFVLGVDGMPSSDGRFLLGDTSRARLSRKGRAFIKRMDNQKK